MDDKEMMPAPLEVSKKDVLQRASENIFVRLFDRIIEAVFGPWLKEVKEEEKHWNADVNRAFVEQQPLRVHSLLYTIAWVVIFLVIWAAWAKIDEVTRGEARVIPSQQVQIIQSQDGGVVKEILIREGDIVEQGQLLISLDQTRSESMLRESRAELLGLRAKVERLSAVVNDQAFQPSEELQQQIPTILAQEKRLYGDNLERLKAIRNIAEEQLTQRKQELTELQARRTQLSKSLQLSTRELNVTRPLVSSGAVSEVELLRLERDTTNISGELEQTKAQIEKSRSSISEAENSKREVELVFFNEMREELSATIARVNALEESNTGLTDRVNQTLVKSPVKGTIKRLYFNTVGGVVLPGREIVEIVPLDDTLLLEAKVQPRDIAFLRPGQEAMVKFTAYDFVVYGGLKGTVERIGADTIIDEEGNAYYNVRVRTTESFNRDDMPIIPGMVAEVDILTGKKTILAYLMKPVLRAKQYALTER
ncbi:MAG: hypothetical protein RL336_697 [Pseudomonadota bacterium]|jgi:adhesin transport system membrane fusion protein